MKIKTFWNTTVGETDGWPGWVWAVWFGGQCVVMAAIIVGVVLLVVPS